MRGSDRTPFPKVDGRIAIGNNMESWQQTKHSCRIGKKLPSANDLPRPRQLPGNLPGNEEVLRDIIAWFGLYRSDKVDEHWPVKG
jgi:hypothetical protein